MLAVVDFDHVLACTLEVGLFGRDVFPLFLVLLVITKLLVYVLELTIGDALAQELEI